MTFYRIAGLMHKTAKCLPKSDTEMCQMWTYNLCLHDGTPKHIKDNLVNFNIPQHFWCSEQPFFFYPCSSVLCPRLLLLSRCLDGFFTDLCDGRNWDHDATEARVQRPLILTIKVLKRRNVGPERWGASTDFFHLVAYNGTGAPVRFGFQLVQITMS